MSIDAVSAQKNEADVSEWQALLNEEALLRISDLRVVYRTERSTANAINGLDLIIHKGESIGLVGETGAGKTTTALSILKLLPADTAFVEGGSIEFDGKKVHEMSKSELKKIRGGKVAMIFQNPLTALNPVFTVGEQISMVLRSQQGAKRKDAMEKAKELLEVVGIAGYRVNEYPFQFSGGMRQRVGIAAALACNPQLLIADEPTTALDVTIQAQILELMRKLQAQYDASLLMITHNLGIIAELCQRVAVMYAGRVIEYGHVHDVFSSPEHPYTFGLLGALPSLTGPRERLLAIPGTIANPQNLPAGCAFHPRCDQCGELCKTEQPGMIHVGNDHYVECFKRGSGNN